MGTNNSGGCLGSTIFVLLAGLALMLWDLLHIYIISFMGIIIFISIVIDKCKRK